MKIVATAKKLFHEGDHLHSGNFFVGDVKTYFSSAVPNTMGQLKSALASEFSAAIQNKIYNSITSITPNLPSVLAGELRNSIENVVAGAINSSLGDSLAGPFEGLTGASFDIAASEFSGTIFTNLQGHKLTSANNLINNLHATVDSNTMTTAVTNVLSKYQSELGEDYSNVLAAAETVVTTNVKDILSDMSTDTFANVGKPLNDLLDGDFGNQIVDALGSGIGNDVKGALSSGGKIIVGGSGLLGSIPSFAGLGKSTIIGSGSAVIGLGKKMIALAEGKVAFAGGISLSSLGLVGGSGSSAFSLGPGGLSIGGKNLTEMLSPTPTNKEQTSYTLDLEDAGGTITMDHSSPNTVTIPPDSAANFKLGDEIHIIQVGAGQTSIAPGSGVSLYSGNSYRKISQQYGKVTVKKRDSNVWILFGDLAA